MKQQDLTRKCNQCGETKPLMKFLEYASGKRSTKCRVCYEGQAKARRKGGAGKRHCVRKEKPIDGLLFGTAMKAFTPIHK